MFTMGKLGVNLHLTASNLLQKSRHVSTETIVRNMRKLLQEKLILISRDQDVHLGDLRLQCVQNVIYDLVVGYKEVIGDFVLISVVGLEWC